GVGVIDSETTSAGEGAPRWGPGSMRDFEDDVSSNVRYGVGLAATSVTRKEETNRLASSKDGTCRPAQRQMGVNSTTSPGRKWGNLALKYCAVPEALVRSH